MSKNYVKTRKNKNILDVKSLSDSTKKRYASALNKLDIAGITITKAKKMSVNDLRNTLNSKASDKGIKSLQRVFNQMSVLSERREISVKYALDDLIKKQNLDNNQQKIVRKRLIKVSGNVFSEVVDLMSKHYKGNTMREIEKNTRDLLNISITDENKVKLLPKFEKDLLLEYGSP